MTRTLTKDEMVILQTTGKLTIDGTAYSISCYTVGFAPAYALAGDDDLICSPPECWYYVLTPQKQQEDD